MGRVDAGAIVRDAAGGSVPGGNVAMTMDAQPV
jgi:hypothetical protein